MNSNTQKKISPLKLEVIKFHSADVIATSAILPLMLIADEYEFIGNFTFANNFVAPNANTINNGYQEPNSGQ